MERKAPAAIIAWAALVVGSAVLAVFEPIFIGVTIGSIMSAMLLLLAVKWSMEDLVSDQMSSINHMEDMLDENIDTEWPDPED